jgi:hypothetical protein
MTVYARVREGVPQPPFDENGDPWDAAAWMFDHVLKRLDAIEVRFIPLEERRAAARGKDGVGILGASINESGHLLLEFSDGVLMDVGRVVGRDAPPAPAPKTLEFQRDDTGRIVKSILR